jgi:dTDP-4-amino-4,6-dideoxygalactose transaminase
MIPLFKVHMPPRDELMPALEQTLYSGYVGQGPRVAEFEEQLGGFLGNRNVLAVNSGTSAIQLALRLAGVEYGRVITTPMTCAATALPILAEGAIPRWADIDPATGNIDPASVERKIDPTVRAILAVHWGGQPCDMTALTDISQRHGVPLIADAAHALGATWGGWPVTAGPDAADYTCFSFQAIKHMTTGDGGLLATRSAEDCERGRLLRWYGIDRDADGEDARTGADIAGWGYKFHMNDVAATIGLAQLRHLVSVLGRQLWNARWYHDQFAGRVKVAAELPGASGAWWLYTLIWAGEAERVAFMQHARARGVAVSRVHARLDRLTCFKEHAAGPLPGVDEFYSRMCCIPVHWALTAGERQRVADTVLSFCERGT